MGKLRQPKRFTGNGKYEIQDLAKDLISQTPDYHEDAVITVEMKPRRSSAVVYIDGEQYGWLDVYEYIHSNGDVYYLIAWSENSILFGDFFFDLDSLSGDEWDDVLSSHGLDIELRPSA